MNPPGIFADLPRRTGIIVAVSGGPDSICLLDIIYEIGRKRDWNIRIGHVNYRLREKDSDSDEIFVREEARRRNIPISILRPKKISPSTSNLEERLREIRYRFFEKERKKYHFDVIALAHHRDDQAETFLLRLLRGSGLDGLGAMREQNEKLIRPLLHTSRAEILRFLKERSLCFRIDQTNADPRFMRNRVRHELLPLLETFNPNIRNILARTTRLIVEDASCNKQSAPLLLERTVIDKQDHFSFSTNNLAGQSPSVVRHTLRTIISKFDSKSKPLSFAKTEELRKFITGTKSKRAEKLFGNLKFIRKGAIVSMILMRVDKPFPPQKNS